MAEGWGGEGWPVIRPEQDTLDWIARFGVGMEPQDRERVIEQWMKRIVQDGGIEHYDDLHLDAIDPQWKHREKWAFASSSAFQDGVAIRNRLKLPFIVALGMSLRDDVLEPIHEAHLSDLISGVDWSPPSLYLFNQEQEPRNDLKAAIRDGRIEPDSVSSDFTAIDLPAVNTGVFLRFKRSGSDEYRTSVFILG